MFVDRPDAPAPAPAHRFNGYFFTYPGAEGHRGLVSTVRDNEPPVLNWIFVDANTRAVRHAGMKDSLGHVVGPWGWSDDEQWLMLRASSDGFVVVEEEEECDGGAPASCWLVYWDPDGLLRRQCGDEGKRCVPVALRRRLKLAMESTYVK